VWFGSELITFLAQSRNRTGVSDGFRDRAQTAPIVITRVADFSRAANGGESGRPAVHNS
jgi:hypothetical protein